MSLHLSNLVLEITRKCNMKCPHCLRGPAQRIDMDLSIINRVTENVDSIYGLTLTGGEPSLNAAAIEHLRWAMYFNHCALEYFWLTVNARFFKEDFYNALRELYCVCGDQEMCRLTISGDQYHFGRSRRALEEYGDLPFFSDERMRMIADDNLLDEGMAKRNQMGRREVDITRKITDFSLDEDSGVLFVGDMVYINAKGDVLLCCDLSYLSQKKYIIGNVLAEPLEQILRRRLSAQAA